MAGRMQKVSPIGYDKIDTEHFTIVEVMARIQTCIESQEWGVVRVASARLISEMMRHFEDEEQLMALRSYPMIEQHQRNHDCARACLSRFEREIDQTTPSEPAVRRCFGELAKIIHHEITDDDPRFVAHLKMLER